MMHDNQTDKIKGEISVHDKLRHIKSDNNESEIKLESSKYNRLNHSLDSDKKMNEEE